MSIKVLKSEENYLEVEVQGEDHTLCNALRKSLLQNTNVEFASYRIDHPLTSSPIIMVRTNGKETPLEALVKSAKNLAANASEFAEVFAAALKKAKE